MSLSWRTTSPAALLVSECGSVAADKLTEALAQAAAARGASFMQFQVVHRVRADAAAITVDTSGEHLAAAAVVLAAGSWTSQIDVGVSTMPVRPLRGQLLYLKWTAPPLRRVTLTPRCYLVPHCDGSVLVGATVEEAGFEQRVTVAGVHDLIQASCDLIPRAGTARFIEARVGLRPATPEICRW